MTQIRTLKEAKVEALKGVKDSGADLVSVSVFECNDYEEATYDVEIHWYARENDDFIDSITTDEFDNESDALKRAKAVMKSVVKWFEYQEVEVFNKIDTYSA